MPKTRNCINIHSKNDKAEIKMKYVVGYIKICYALDVAIACS